MRWRGEVKQAIRQTIEKPDAIKTDAVFSDTEVYYKKRGNKFIKVAVRFVDETNGEMRTAFLAGNAKKLGEILVWPPT